MSRVSPLNIKSFFKAEGGGLMPDQIYFGWGLLVPACLSLLYGFTAYHATSSLGYSSEDSSLGRILTSLPSLVLFTVWGMVDIPLPVIYVLAYAGKLTRLFSTRGHGAKELFLINLTHLTTMALHMILIGVFALAADMSMRELLEEPAWRIITIGIVLTVNNVIAWMTPRWDMVLEVFRTQAESEEVHPFMLFLWFCNIFLLLDSVLCIAKIDWGMLPLFLIGSTVLLEFYLVRFLKHLYSLLKVHYLAEEHSRLAKELEQKERNAEKLRNQSIQDSLTGIFSRRYVMEQAEFLLREHTGFSMVFIDLDHLKQINDKDGHHAGDCYLIRFAKEFGTYLRKSDIFARVGGDEFLVLLPGCRMEAAEKRMAYIRSGLNKENGPAFSFSYGVAEAFEESDEHVDQMIRRADQAMYRDKQTRTQ